MQICFVDEAGDLGVVNDPPRSNDQPVLVVGGLFVGVHALGALTHEFLDLKQRYFPGLPYRSDRRLDRVLPEIKGAEVRANATRGTPRQRRHAISFLDRLLGLLDRYEIRLVARVWVKSVGSPFEPVPVYTSSIQGLCSYFDHYLSQTGDHGVCIADSRNKFKNVTVSHSIFTQKFSSVARTYERLAELPTFGHSENHVGLQVCDLVCSALLYPIASFAYCTGHVANVHVQPNAALLRRRYGAALKALQYRYRSPTTNRFEGGIVVSDPVAQRNGSWMFRDPQTVP